MPKILFEARYAFQFILLAIFCNVKLIHLSINKQIVYTYTHVGDG